MNFWRSVLRFFGLDPHDDGRPAFLVRAIILMSAIFVIVAEFFLDLRTEPEILRIVTVVDVVIVFGFFVYLAGHAIARRRDLRSFFIDERIEILLLGVSLTLVVLAPRAGAIGIIVRIIYFEVRTSLEARYRGRVSPLTHLRPSRALALSFIALISIGAVLLLLPAATTDGQGASITDAFFTMASATSVTGLVVKDTGTYFTGFGLGVILVVAQFGAIGIMVLAAAFAVLVGGRIASSSRESLTEAGFGDLVDVSTADGLRQLFFAVAYFTIATEIIGTVLLYGAWLTGLMELRPEYDEPFRALWWCFFHSVSAFCHAGFSLEPSSLMPFVDNYTVNGIFGVLIVLGAVGFPVIADVTTKRKRRRSGFGGVWETYHLQTRVVLVSSLILTVGGMVAFLFFEYDGALNGLSIPSKVMASLFQSVTTRSAGFNTVAMDSLTAPTVIIFVILFFVGSAPGSTGGGVRLTTATVVLMSVRAMLRARDDVEVMGRTLPKIIVYRSIAIVLVGGSILAGLLVLMAATQSLPLDKLIFETASAYGTVGLSMGITQELDTTGRWLMTFAMYVGRVGPLTLALAVAESVSTRGYKYPEGRMAVG